MLFNEQMKSITNIRPKSRISTLSGETAGENANNM